MQDLQLLEPQLFHTYTTVSTKDISPEQHLAEMLEGRLTLSPHGPQLLGRDFLWSVDPLGDANWRFQFHSLVWLDNLRVASEGAPSIEGIHLYESLLRSWIENNPVEDPPSDYSWFDMSVGLRAIVLLNGLRRFGTAQWLIDSIVQHGEHLADPKNYDSKGNHGLHQDMGLVAIAQYLDRRDWLTLAADRIHTMLLDAIDVEGVSREGSIDYQYRNFRWYEEAFRRLKAAEVDLPEDFETILTKMPTFMAHATSPSAMYAMIGDTLLHRAPIIPGTATEWVKKETAAPQERVALYDSGYIFARSSWKTWSEDLNTSYMTLRFGSGRSTAVHGHEDAGSITFDAFGERLLCDSGLFAYEAGDDRLFFRGRSSHNVIDVDGRKYYPSAESPLLFHHFADDYLMATVLVKGLEGVVWYRTVFHSLKHGYIIIDDRVQDKGDGNVLQRWQLPEGSVFTLDPISSGVHVSTPMNNEILFSNLGHCAGVRLASGGEEPIEGWRSDEYRKKYATPNLSFIQRGEGSRFTTLVQARGARVAKNGQWATVSGVFRSSKFLSFSIEGSNWKETIRLSSESVIVTPG